MNEQEKYDWMVYVSCATFNHAPYIEDAMNGFTMQKTDFPFVCAIIDDASTDGEQKVIENYLNEHFDLEDKKVARQEDTNDYFLTFARHKTNLNCYFAAIFLKYNHYSIKKPKLPYIVEWRDKAKYIALCEGDDYWIDPLKLHKQADAMEVHPEVDMCACAAIVTKDDKEIGQMSPADKETTLPIEKVICEGGGLLSTNTLFYRNSLFNHLIYSSSNYYNIDYFLQIDGAMRGGIYFSPLKMAVYRKYTKSSWTLRMSHEKRLFWGHLYKEVAVLSSLDLATNRELAGPIENAVKKIILSMTYIGIRNGCFDSQIKKMTYKARFKYILVLIMKFFTV